MIDDVNYKKIIQAIEKHYKKDKDETLTWTDYCIIWEKEYFLEKEKVGK